MVLPVLRTTSLPGSTGRAAMILGSSVVHWRSSDSRASKAAWSHLSGEGRTTLTRVCAERLRTLLSRSGLGDLGLMTLSGAGLGSRQGRKTGGVSSTCPRSRPPSVGSLPVHSPLLRLTPRICDDFTHSLGWSIERTEVWHLESGESSLAPDREKRGRGEISSCSPGTADGGRGASGTHSRSTSSSSFSSSR